MLNNSVALRKKTVLICISIVGVAAVMAYLLYPSNPIAAASILAISPLLICPIACAAIVLLIWIGAKFSRR